TEPAPDHPPRRRPGVAELLRTARARALRFHLALEARLVDGEPLAGEDVLGEIEGEAVGVVEAEGNRPRKRPSATRAGLRDLALEQGEAAVERRREALLLAAHHLGDVPLALGYLGIGPPHATHHGPQDLVQDRPLEPEELTVARRPPE